MVLDLLIILLLVELIPPNVNDGKGPEIEIFMMMNQKVLTW